MLLGRHLYQKIATEISLLAAYCDRVVCLLASEEEIALFQLLDAPSKEIARGVNELEVLLDDAPKSTIIVCKNSSDTHAPEQIFNSLAGKLSRSSRIVLLTPTPFSPKGAVGFEVVSIRPAAFFSFNLGRIGSLIESLLSLLPVAAHFSSLSLVILRPLIREDSTPSLSIVIPARNEAGNIPHILPRLPDFNGADLEIVFVEGHSRDDTWEEIQRVLKDYSGPHIVKAFKQQGEGKGDAVRLGFSHCTKDVFTILDADLSVPPEKLEEFYFAYCEGKGDFINGNRMLYPMESGAMRFLNKLGNIFFASMLSYILNIRIGDALCGTKMFSHRDYLRFAKWREDFGDHDPFGDFDLLFPAAQFALGVVDVPVNYQRRTYGTTNIKRFRHGLMLAKMSWLGFLRRAKITSP